VRDQRPRDIPRVTPVKKKCQICFGHFGHHGRLLGGVKNGFIGRSAALVAFLDSDTWEKEINAIGGNIGKESNGTYLQLCPFRQVCLYGEPAAAAAAVVPFVGVWGNL